MRAFIISCFSVLVVLPAGSAWAGLPEIFARGNEAFWSGDLEAATEAYEELIELGVRDEEVYYNLGTAHGRLGHHGQAILNFERALHLAPGHEDARHNLVAVRRALARQRNTRGEDADLDPPRSLWLSMLEQSTASGLGIAFLVCYVLLFGILSWRRVTSRELLRLVLVIAAPVAGCAALVLGLFFAGKVYFDAELREAIVTGGDQVVLREGPADRFRRAFVAREGDRVLVLDEERSWLLVRNDEGREAWGQADQFGEIRLPSID